MASLRNLAIGALRLAGRCDITEATRWASRNMNRPFTILELTLSHYSATKSGLMPRMRLSSPLSLRPKLATQSIIK
jgi:hypothetical protein